MNEYQRTNPLLPADQKILDKILELCTVTLSKDGKRKIKYRNFILMFEPGGELERENSLGFRRTFFKQCHFISIQPKKGINRLGFWAQPFRWACADPHDDKNLKYTDPDISFISLENCQECFVEHMQKYVEALCSTAQRKIERSESIIAHELKTIEKYKKQKITQEQILKEFEEWK